MRIVVRTSTKVIFRRVAKAQAMVEFTLALPILLLVMYGLIETGRVIFIYSTVVTASREAVRFGSAWGVDDAGYPHYQDCTGIRNAAKNVGFLLNLQDSNIVVSYDHGLDSSGNPVTMPSIPNCTATSGAQTSVVLNPSDRVNVAVSYNYSPILNFVPLTAHTFSSAASRTIMGDVDLSATEPPGH